MTETRREDIVTDEEIDLVHGHARFGSMSKRRVVDEGVLKSALGYGSGSTAIAIMQGHGLIRRAKGRSTHPTLTKKGVRYLHAMKGSHRIDEILDLMLQEAHHDGCA